MSLQSGSYSALSSSVFFFSSSVSKSRPSFVTEEEKKKTEELKAEYELLRLLLFLLGVQVKALL